MITGRDFGDPGAPTGESIGDNLDMVQAVRKLPPRWQAVLALRQHGYKQREIAGLLEIARTNAWADEWAGTNLLKSFFRS